MVTVQPRDFVVSANQLRACLSVSERERRDMPVSVGALGYGQILTTGQTFALKESDVLLRIMSHGRFDGPGANREMSKKGST